MYKPAIQFGELLVVHQPAARINNVVVDFEVYDFALGAGGLFAQLLGTILHPGTCAPRSLVFRPKLIGDVSIGHRIRDLFRSTGIERLELDADNVSQSNSFDRQLTL